MKKAFLTIAGIAITVFSYATDRVETKEAAKSETPVAVKVQQEETTYYVTGQSGSNYLISTDPANDPQCTSGSIPCKFTSSEDLGTSVPKHMVDNQEEDIQIINRRPSLP